MSEWKKVRLGDVCNVKGGKRLPKGVNLLLTPTLHPYIRVRDLNGKKTIELDDSFEYVDSKTQKVISRYTVAMGDVILSIVGTIGLAAKVGETLHNANLTENCVKLVNYNGILSEFLYYFLTSNVGQEEIARGIVGAVQAKLPIKNIQNISIQLPPLEEQRRIAGILGVLDDKIELNNRINQNLEEQAAALFRRWFVDFEFPDANGNPYKSSGGTFINSPLGEIPTGWKAGIFRDIISSTIGGDWGKESAEANYSQKVYCIRGADITDVSKGEKGKMPFRYILQKNHISKKLEENDLVVEISGGSPTQSTGRIAIISDSLLKRYDEDMICTNFCRAIKPKTEYAHFIYSLWRYMYDQNIMFSYENGTTGIKNLNINGLIDNEQIIIPCIDILKNYNNLQKRFFNTIFNNALESEALATLRDTLLPKLMNNEI